MSSRFTSAFDELLEQSRRELDALYRDAAPAGPSRSAPPSEPPPSTAPAQGANPSAAPGGPFPARAALPASHPPPASSASLSRRPPSAARVERLLDERYGDGWRFEVTSRRREGNEVIVVGTLRLPGADGGLRAQFGSAPVAPAAGSGGGASGSAGGVGFSFGGGGPRGDPRAAEEAAFERARQDALASCAATIGGLKEA